MAESGLAPSPVATPYSPNAAVCREIQDRIRGARRLTRAAGMVEAFSDPAEAALAAALRRLELLPPAATAHFTPLAGGVSSDIWRVEDRKSTRLNSSH